MMITSLSFSKAVHMITLEAYIGSWRRAGAASHLTAWMKGLGDNALRWICGQPFRTCIGCRSDRGPVHVQYRSGNYRSEASPKQVLCRSDTSPPPLTTLNHDLTTLLLGVTHTPGAKPNHVTETFLKLEFEKLDVLRVGFCWTPKMEFCSACNKTRFFIN